MVVDARTEVLRLVVRTYTHDGVAKLLKVSSATLHRWLLGDAAVPESVLASLLELVDPGPTVH